MKCIIVNFLELNELPPALNLLNYIENSIFEGIYISLYKEVFIDKYKNVLFYHIYNDKEKFTGQNNISEKIKYKKCALKKRIAAKQIIKLIDKIYDENSVVWFLHESTALALGVKIKKYDYYVTLYELDAAQYDKHNTLKKICNSAKKVIVPEETRAHIVKAFLNLSEKPLVIHNKPYILSNDSKNTDSTSKIIEKINLWKKENKLIFIYAGIFMPERKLDNIITAFSLKTENTKLLLMGRQSYYLDELMSKYNGKFEYIGFYEPPEHLDIIKHADVGILTYIPQNGSINAVFCAPNKIYEYGMYGLPVLGNDIPGLKNLINYKKIGLCFDESYVGDIKLKIDGIIKKYNFYSKNIVKYTSEIDIDLEIENVLFDEREND